MRISDWSSDVCSSDLGRPAEGPADGGAAARRPVRHFRQQRVRYRGAVAGESRICGAAAELSWFRELRPCVQAGGGPRSEEHTSELQSLMRISYAVFCLKKKTDTTRSYI